MRGLNEYEYYREISTCTHVMLLLNPHIVNQVIIIPSNNTINTAGITRSNK
jgi:hypothetical protein